jgi:hypothetical protein
MDRPLIDTAAGDAERADLTQRSRESSLQVAPMPSPSAPRRSRGSYSAGASHAPPRGFFCFDSGCVRLALYCLGTFCNGFFVNIRGSVIQDLATQCGVTVATMSTFFFASGLGGMISALPAGLFVDHIGNPHMLLAAGLCIRAISSAAVPFVTSLVGMCAIGALQGSTLPLVGVALRTCIVRNKGSSSGGSLNLVMGSFGLGSIFSPMAYLLLQQISSGGGGGGGGNHTNTSNHTNRSMHNQTLPAASSHAPFLPSAAAAAFSSASASATASAFSITTPASSYRFLSSSSSLMSMMMGGEGEEGQTATAVAGAAASAAAAAAAAGGAGLNGAHPHPNYNGLLNTPNASAPNSTGHGGAHALTSAFALLWFASAGVLVLAALFAALVRPAPRPPIHASGKTVGGGNRSGNRRGDKRGHTGGNGVENMTDAWNMQIDGDGHGNVTGGVGGVGVGDKSRAGPPRRTEELSDVLVHGGGGGGGGGGDANGTNDRASSLSSSSSSTAGGSEDLDDSADEIDATSRCTRRFVRLCCAGGGIKSADLGIIVILTLFLGASVAAENTIGQWIFTVGTADGFSGAMASALNSTLWAVFTFTRFFVGALSTMKRSKCAQCLVRPHRLLSFSMLLGVAPLLLFLFATAAGEEHLVLWILVVTFGISSAIWFPNGMALGTQLVHGGRFSGTTVAFFELSANAGAGVGPAVAGWLGKSMGVGYAADAVMWSTLVSIVAMQVFFVPLWCLVSWRPRPD